MVYLSTSATTTSLRCSIASQEDEIEACTRLDKSVEHGILLLVGNDTVSPPGRPLHGDTCAESAVLRPPARFFVARTLPTDVCSVRRALHHTECDAVCEA